MLIPHPLNPFIWLILTLLDIYYGIVWAWLILSWLIMLNIVNRYQPIVKKADYALFKLTYPLVSRIRKFMPKLGDIDISPIVLIIGIHFIEYVVLYYA